MTSIPTNHALLLSGLLLVIGVVGVLTRRNLIFVLMSLEIILSSVGIAFVAAASKWHQPDGQVVVIFILVTAASEVGVGLALVLRIFRQSKTVDSDELSSMKG
jgi:NADH-quinone oxidoreductase subunit K